MSSFATSAPVFRFGVFEADVARGELRKFSLPIKLQDRPFQILVTLLERPGVLVTREELRQRLWPDGTFVDFDHSISSSVHKLRAVLGDSSRTPRFIETVGSRGYRFIYPVESLTSSPPVVPPPVAPDLSSPPPSPAARSRIPWLALSLISLLIAASLAISVLHRPSPRPLRSIAVLPLRNLSQDPQQDYFSEGLTDDLIARLASLGELRVISQTSAMQYKQSRKPLPQIARELKVDSVLEGSVARSGGRVHITAQLVDAASDRTLWAQTYDESETDIFKLQNEVARNIADNIRLRLNPAERQRLSEAAKVDPQSYDDYLQGRFHMAQRTGDELQIAISYFERAVERDPSYARAYAALADAYALLGGYAALPQGALVQKARTAALRSLQLDPLLAEPHASLALLAENYDYDWTTAEREYKRSIELDPNYVTAHHWYAEFLNLQGRFSESFAEFEKARALDPFSLAVEIDYALAFYYMRDYDRSIETFRDTMQKQRFYGRAALITLPLLEKGMDADALRIANEMPADPVWKPAVLCYVHARTGKRTEALRELAEIERFSSTGTRDVTPLLSAYLGLGDKERAIATLYAAYAQHSTAITSLKVNPLYDPIRNEPRFQELERKLGLL